MAAIRAAHQPRTFWPCAVLGAQLLFPGTAWAAAPVEESQATTQRSDEPRPATVPRTDAGTRDSGGINTFYYQLQTLQEDVRRLQGVVEEQNYRIDRLNREQRERYIELDQRLLELRRGAPPLGDAATADPAEADASRAGVAASRDMSASATERDAYNAAIAVVQNAARMPPSERRQEHERALVLFNALIEDHPNGQFTPNAFYWVGEVHLAMDNLELARQALVQVVNLYGDHAKVPGALYKLGIVYHRIEDPAKALEYLDRVIHDYPDHEAAGLARSYAAELR